MKTLQESVCEYVQLRQSLGYKFVGEAIVLREFARYMAQQREAHVTTAAALRFALLRPLTKSSTQSIRYGVVSRFAIYHRLHDDPLTEQPPPKLIPRGTQRARPCFYSDAEILRLLEAAKHYHSKKALLPASYYCLFGLLVVTGMRVGEALGLEDRDIDEENAVLTIRGAKFGKDRLVPLHASTMECLRAYQKTRDDLVTESNHRSAKLFLTSRGTALSYRRVYHVYRRMRLAAGLDLSISSRLHDLRHRFAVETLLRWYRQGEPVDRRLPVLATYLGHASMAGTYWYLSCTPALMAAAATRVDQRWEGGRP